MQRIGGAEALVKELKDLGVRAAAFQADQADSLQVEALVNNTARRFGKLDILVNNAGVFVVGQVGAPDSDVVNVQDSTASRAGGTELGVSGGAAVQAPAGIGSGSGATIAAAAYAQIGVSQDCTALATNALAAAGVHFHGWPAGYLSLGRTVSAGEARPGDLAYYQNGGVGMAHIAVYVGNGMAVHGGWNGGTTVLYSVNVGSGPVFIRRAARPGARSRPG